jgi:hypothetical protein
MRSANLRSSSADNDQLVDFPLNIIVRESNSSVRYLTNQGVNAELCFANYDANNNVKHTFYLMKSNPLTNQFCVETPDPEKNSLFSRRLKFLRHLCFNFVAVRT